MHGLEGKTIESLRVILEGQQCRPVAFKEASEVGASLISFYELLADDPRDKNNEK